MGEVVGRRSSTDQTTAAIREVLAGRRRGARSVLLFAGPAVIASIAYMDPGNFATNIQAGARFGYTLLWVVVMANMIAMLFQALSAKLGIVTSRNLAELCRIHFSLPTVLFMWAASEIAAMATDLAELLGAAIGLSLLTGLALLPSLILAGAGTYAILLVQGMGFRPIEIIVGGFIAIIGGSYLAELFLLPPDWAAVARHVVLPELADSRAAMLAVGIVGATVMPHAIYLHSSLTQDRIPAVNDEEKRRILRYSNREVLVALGIAGLINMAMVMMSAVVYRGGGSEQLGNGAIETAYLTLIPLLGIGAAAAGIFMLSLLASGFSSSVVGTMAGQVIMQGFVGFRIPLWVRRLVTMLPSLIVVAIGVNATDALVLSQIVLSLVLPIPMIALIRFTGRRDIMGGFANSRLVSTAALVAAGTVLALDSVLLLDAFGLSLFPR
jgi:manganese transport protein